jgi:hypothetical protein
MTRTLTSVPLALVLTAWAFLGAASGVPPCEATELPGDFPNPLTKTWVFDIDPDRDVPQQDFGASLRVRYVDFENALALGTEPDPRRRFFRLRTRAWGERWLTRGWRLVGQINNESRRYLECESCKGEFDEVIVENLFIEFTNQENNPMGLRIGRQNLFYGDGFVICDGTPLDGSRTSYVNGILLTTAIPDWAFDLFAVLNREEDEWMPRINSKHTRLLEYDEFVGGLYLRRFNPEGPARPYTIDYYYIFKYEETPERFATINTFGARIEATLRRATITGEIAYQGGKAPESRFALAAPDLAGPQSVAAYGGQVGVQVHSSARLPLDLSGGYVHLSGDDPITRNKFEAWNPIMGRWPKWSELYIYTLSMAADVQPMGQGIAHWQNFKAPHLEITFTPRERLTLEAGHMWMYADESVPLDTALSPSDVPEGPKDRGNLLALKLSWAAEVVLPITGHILYERFDPGGYYGPDAKTANFFRIEISSSL